MKKHILTSAFSSLLMMLLVSSCSNSDDNNDTGAANYKITVTLSNVNETDDFVSVVAVGSKLSGGNTYPMWKVNEEEEPATQSVSLGDTDFTGSTTTYVIQSIYPLDLVELGTQIINYGQDLTGKIKVEKDGNIVLNQSINLIGNNKDFTKDYSFN